MFRNYLAAALNNLARNRLYAAISIVGLAVGMAAAILTGLYIRDELTFDHFIRGHERLYVVDSDLEVPGRAPIFEAYSPAPTYQWLREDFPGVEGTARRMSAPGDVRHGDVEAVETIDWVDPDFFKLLPLKAIAGDPDAAIRQPDGVVLTRSMARKYFGRDNPIGEMLELRRSSFLRVRAVIEDLPRNTHLVDGIYASALATGSTQKVVDARPYPRGGFGLAGMTYVRFRSAKAAAAAAADMHGLVERHMMLNGRWLAKGLTGGLALIPLDRMHLTPFGGSSLAAVSPPGDPAALWALAAIAALTLAMAAVNFVNLATARATRRAVEVGIRKAAGAERRDLIVQFIGEALIYAFLALVFAMAIVEIGLPALNAALLRSMSFQPWRDPGLCAALLGLAVLLGLLAGIYPAFVLSSFRPALVLKSGGARGTGSAAIRGGLVTLQFAVLIGLLLSTVVIVQQTRFALEGNLKAAADQVLILDLSPPNHGPVAVPKPMCRNALIDEIRKLPGVREAACANSTAIDQGDNIVEFVLANGQRVDMGAAPVDQGFFELYGIRPLAGRTLTRDPSDEGAYIGAPPTGLSAPTVVLNEKAARQMGFAQPAKAVGATLRFTDLQSKPDGAVPAVVVGVVPDFAFDLIHGPVRPLVYFVIPPALNLLNIKLTGQDVRGTVAAIDALWKRLGEPRAVSHRFLNQDLDTLYASVIRQEMLITALAFIAVVIAALGLFGMAAFTAERRTKEIGIRKAMGASRRDIVRLLLWQFTTPVLWASLIALPIAGWAMERWLQGFSARISLQPWLFAAAPAAALVIAWATVLAHTLKVAAEKPVNALRYE